MIGVGVGPAFQAVLQRKSIPKRFDFASGALSPSLGFSRDSAASFVDGTGEVAQALVNAARFDFAEGAAEPALLYEPSATNTAGYSATPADNLGWYSTSVQNGLAITRVATGHIGGLDYADYQVQGTATSNFTDRFYISSQSRVSAVQGETFSGSCYVQIVGGSTANIGKFTTSIIEENGANGYLGQTNSLWSIDFPALTRVGATRTLANATAGHVRLALVMSSMTVGGAIDITLRLAGPQLEKGDNVSSLIEVPSDTHVTRSAEALTLPVYEGNPDVIVTFSDGSMTTVSYASLAGGVLPHFSEPRIAALDVAAP